VTALLEIRGLVLELETPRGPVAVVERLDLALQPAETLALVGESGCGKTLTAQAVLGCLPQGVRVAAGEIRFRGRDLLAMDARARRALCGKELALSFQEPASALNPVLSVGEQVAEVLRVHAGLARRAAWRRATEVLSEVGLERAGEHARRYPHELSGGQRQRVMLAMALAPGPALLIADEPTSALDAPLQKEILGLFSGLRERREMALVVITHDLAVVAELAERVAVMYAGRIVEEGSVLALFEHPGHPYTVGLLRSRPSARRGGERFAALPGQVAAPGAWPSGCPFRTRCALADERCTHDEPRLLASRAIPRAPDPTLEVASQRVACHHAGEARVP
jgi:oligopeptide/dipeptide ABC transporter ATP-binding protein